jgi:hypothetical protein
MQQNIGRTARYVRRHLEQSNRELFRGDIGVIEIGECFYEYSKHQDKVRRGEDAIEAKEVVEEIYGPSRRAPTSASRTC